MTTQKLPGTDAARHGTGDADLVPQRVGDRGGDTP